MPKKKSAPDSSADTVLRIFVDRDITGDYVYDLEQQFKDAVPQIDRPVVLDLTAIQLIHSRGIALIVGLFRECEQRTVPFSIEATAELCAFFRLIKLDRVITFTEKARAA
jgi:anti-anti-sigma regulatory factor